MFFRNTDLLQGMTSNIEPYCWPYFESCWRWRVPSHQETQLILFVYQLLLVGAGIALWRHSESWFRVLLFTLNAGLFLIVSMDYRLRANEFYMLFWIQGVYLIGRRLDLTIPLAIISCYFWAGILKLNWEWLSGSVLYFPLWGIPSGWTPAACAYVVLLELVAIWGLLARRRLWRIAVLTQLGLFHLQSLSQIHWFYPLLMATFLAWFPIAASHRSTVGSRLGELARGRVPAVGYLVLVAFGALQMIPHMYSGDSILTGQGRVFALHMFEARQDCRVYASVAGAPVGSDIDLRVESLSPRLICDPIVYFNRAQNLCRAGRKSDPRFDFRLTMRSKRRTEARFTTIIDETQFCASEHEYSILMNNLWFTAGLTN